MTPECASPEQVVGAPVTTATDIYSAGAVLFELLSGRRPHEEAEASPASLERHIVDHDVALASAACQLDSARATAATRAAARSATVDQIARDLGGDLDNIVAKTLRREPAERYGSIAALRDDLERYRDGRPVTARPSTVRYRTAKFLRRHRLGVAAASLVVAAVVVGTTTTLVQARAAAREGRRAAEIRDFLVSVFEISDPDDARGEAVTARELLDRGSERIERSLAGDGELQAEMRGVLGRLYQRLGLFDKAATHLEGSLAASRTGGAEPALLVDKMLGLASVRSEQSHTKAAEALIREALVLARSEEGPQGPAVASVLTDLAAVHRARTEFAEAESVSREALAIRRALDDRPGLLATLNGLGVLLQDAGRPLEAIAALEEAHTIGRTVYGDLHTDTDQQIAAGLTAVVAALSGELACGEVDRRSAEEPVGTVVCSKQRTDFVFQPLVAAARVAKKSLALYRGNVERGLQQLIDLIPAVIVHWRLGSRALDTARLSRFSTPASR